VGAFRECMGVVLLTALVALRSPAGETLYVDPQLDSAQSTAYDPAARSATGGKELAYKTLAGAAGAALAGQTVLIRGGTYTEALEPRNSGAAGKPLAFRSYPNEKVVITGATLCPAVNISNRQYLIIEGLEIRDVKRWLYALSAHHNIIRNNTFLRAQDPGGSAKTGLFFQEANHNQVLSNRIEDSTQDNLALIRSDRNLVSGNRILKAAHTLWTIKGGSFNVFRDNYFHNQVQKIGEVYDCDEVGFDHQFSGASITKHNVIERNVFAYAPSSGNHAPFAGIQYAGQEGIIRHNCFYDLQGPGLDLTLYGKEARYNTDNRVYHNVFACTAFAGVALAGGEKFSGNVFKNNVLAFSRFVPNDTRWKWFTTTLKDQPVQLLVARRNGFCFTGNVFFGGAGPDRRYLITVGSRDWDKNTEQHEVSWWEAHEPQLFGGNLECDPLFVNLAARDFHPAANSPLVDAGVFLTRTANAGTGTEMPVEDAGYFFDGYEMAGGEGDPIQLEGQTQRARIKQVDYTKKLLLLDQPLVWTAGQNVHLSYAGKRPDIGAYELGLDKVEAPAPGTGTKSIPTRERPQGPR